MKKFLPKSALLLAAYLVTLPVLNVLHLVEHDHHHDDHYPYAETGQTVLSEKLCDCNLCYVYQTQKFFDSNAQVLHPNFHFLAHLETSETFAVSENNTYVSLRAPPFFAV